MKTDSDIRQEFQNRFLGKDEELLATAEPVFEGRQGEFFVTDRRIVFGTKAAGNVELLERPGTEIEHVGPVDSDDESILRIEEDDFEFESVEDRSLIEYAVKAQFVEDADVSFPGSTTGDPWYASGTGVLFAFFACSPIGLYGVAMRMLEGGAKESAFLAPPIATVVRGLQSRDSHPCRLWVFAPHSV